MVAEKKKENITEIDFAQDRTQVMKDEYWFSSNTSKYLTRLY